MDELEQKIEKALSTGGLSVWYQPIYNRDTGTFDAAEALMRLHYQDSILPTLASIRMMEQNGKIVDVGREVFERTCYFMNRYRDLVPSSIHVNLSCRQMTNLQNADDFIDIARCYDVSPQKLNLEITETEDCGEEGLMFVHKLLAVGFSFSLDDFGTVLSNCNRLMLYPVKVVKTDKSFLDAAIRDKKAEQILNGVFHLAESVQCETVVEGIEDASQIDRDFLVGIRHFQGNAFAKAMPEEQYIQFLRDHAERRQSDADAVHLV